MKELIDETRMNLYVIKDKVCSSIDEAKQCFDCPFGEENCDNPIAENGWICTIDNMVYSLNHYRYYFMEEDKCVKTITLC